ncbi:unnamed protein product [Dracunculus medinensis]|uniref:Beta-hexosaminidase n=1 Tax=Dracunculus medinensis TaxID=318479 RepID=A0A0N4U6D6_DRAME|nr:unnamed protein product [Dracunculus medinensis]
MNVHGQWPDPYKKTYGAIWPLPQNIQNSSKIWSIDPKNFKIESDYQCDIITNAIDRYTKRLFPISNKRLKISKLKQNPQNALGAAKDQLGALHINILIACPSGFPPYNMDESYELDVTQKKAILSANEVRFTSIVWGALRGLESFSHMVYYNKTSGYQIRAEIVKDFPRFPHRGVLLDTSRHFLSVNALKGNIDLMAQNKFNVFHWHMTDTESCPYSSRVLPKLDHGAYDDKHKYTIEEITDVIAYARLRGIRVIPEFDSPAHVGSWGKGYPNILAKCYAEGFIIDSFKSSILDPTKDETWDFLETLFREVYQIFPDEFIHIGGDEAYYWSEPCWKNNKNISDFMKEIFESGAQLMNSIIQVWQGNTYRERMEYMRRITDAGIFAILSSCWYLNDIASLRDWIIFYHCDPAEFDGSEAQKKLVLGGEAALWGEWVDETNIFARLWPRASAVAERLWSPSNFTTSAINSWPRLYEMQCRMVSRGFSVQPGFGPGFCDIEHHITLPV